MGEVYKLDAAEHDRVLHQKVIPESGMAEAISHRVPKAVILAGQPGSGKGDFSRRLTLEMKRDVVVVDPDELREYHEQFSSLRQHSPYAWAAHTQHDATQWSRELGMAAIDARKNIIVDTTLGDRNGALDTIRLLRSRSYEFEVRAVVANHLESSWGVENRFAKSFDQYGYGRYVTDAYRKQVYAALPGNLDALHEEGVRIRLFSREGTELYDNRSDARLPGAVMEREREARMRNPQLTHATRDGWREIARWHDTLAQRAARNPKVDAATQAAVVLDRDAHQAVPVVKGEVLQSKGVDHTARVRPTMVRGAAIAGTTSTVVEAVAEGRRAAELYAAGNPVAAEAAILNFGARSAGGWAGAVAGAKLGTLAGIESGPGAIVTGLIGAGIGAWGAEDTVRWIEQYSIHHQKDAAGRVWSFDPRQPGKGWTHNEREILGSVGTQADRPIHGATEVQVADATLTEWLNFKASSQAVVQRLGQPDRLVDPYRIAADFTDTPSQFPREWRRDPASGQWQREVVHEVYERGIQRSSMEIAGVSKAALLDAYAQTVVEHNVAHSAYTVSRAYLEAYIERGWWVQGDAPDAVMRELQNPERLLAIDGRTYQHRGDGRWQHVGVLWNSHAEGDVHAELSARYAQISVSRQRDASVHALGTHQLERWSPQEREAYQLALQDAQRQGMRFDDAQRIATEAVQPYHGARWQERPSLRAADQGTRMPDTEPRTVPAAVLPQRHTSVLREEIMPANDRTQVGHGTADGMQKPATEVPQPIRMDDAAEPKPHPADARHNAHTQLPERTTQREELPKQDVISVEDGLKMEPTERDRSDAERREAMPPAAAREPAGVLPTHEPLQETDRHPAAEPEAFTFPVVALADVPTQQADEPRSSPRQHANDVQQEPPSQPLPTPTQEGLQQVQLPRDPRQPDHPDHTLYQQICTGVAALDAQHGRGFDETSERLSMRLLVLARENGLQRVDHVVLSQATASTPAGHQVFVVQGEMNDPAQLRGQMPTSDAAQTDQEDSLELLDVVTREQRQRDAANLLDQQHQDLEEQHAMQIRAASGGG
ncbi:zeta toxin family protein [uncultured Stenotrophomonas sp.]|uniref:zeta toxin family protein n=1 Tax=uncultured Stenotrophomonas sp. TaxID=165438 RepID=UPI0025E9E4EA|nr:zeta toxin family protein [uncultured Stenotrophomonas sp.]